MSISYPASRVMSAATAAYAVYALVKPSHLADAVDAQDGERGGFDSLARFYGVRDLAVSAVGVFGPGALVPWAMRTRMAGDLADCVTLVAKTEEGKVRGKVAAVTLGWAALNYLALRRDRRGS